MKILLHGLCGHMGQEVVKLVAAGYKNAVLTAGVDAFATGNEAVPCAKSFDGADPNVDCIVDFSHHSQTLPLLAFAKKHRLPIVLSTTGQTEEELAAIYEASREIPIFYSANMSFGVALLIELAKKTAAAMPEAEIEIVESHHDRKIDAPSGTAKMLVDALCEVRPTAYPHLGRSGQGKRTPEEIGVHSLRMGNVVGIHEVIVATQNQTITLKHEAHSRALFAEGALTAAAFLCGKPSGLYNMKDMV